MTKVAAMQPWRIGDVFLVENQDHLYTVGQIVAQEREVLNSVTCAFFNLRVKSKDEATSIAPSEDASFAVLFVTRDLLDRGVWPVVAHSPVSVKGHRLPHEHLRSRGWVGAKVIGSGIVQRFLDAFHGLAPWDEWKDPNYLDGLLTAANKKPANLLFKGRK